MRHVVNRTLVVGLVLAFSGCANTTQIDALNAKISTLENQISNATNDAASAKATASQATAAENSANRTTEYSQDTNNKLDSLQKK